MLKIKKTLFVVATIFSAIVSTRARAQEIRSYEDLLPKAYPTAEAYAKTFADAPKQANQTLIILESKRYSLYHPPQPICFLRTEVTPNFVTTVPVLTACR